MTKGQVPGEAGALPRLGASGPPVRRSRKPPVFYFSRSRMPST